MIRRMGTEKLFFSLLILFTGLSGVFADTEINIYYTASLNGNLVGCVCKDAPKAGLASSAAYMRNINRENAIIVDLGDFSDARPDSLLAGSIIDVYTDLGYSLSGLGDQELIAGVDSFLTASNRLKILCNNLMIDGKPRSPGPVVIEKKGIEIGIASVIEPDVFFFYPAATKNRLEISHPSESARLMLRELELMGADYKILLFHGHMETAEEIFADQKGWDALLAAHDQMLYEKTEGSRVIASPGEEGNRVGRLRLTFAPGKPVDAENSFRYFKYHVDPEDPEVLQAFEEYKQVLIGNLKSGKK